MPCRCLPIFALLFLLPASSLAQEPEFGASAEVERPPAAVDEHDATAAASEVEMGEHPLREADADVVLRDFEGLTPQRLGGAGARSSLSIRGAAAAHTELLIDGLPLSGPITGGPDLSTVRLEAFDRVRLYRGGVPAWIGLSAIGGVINLIPHVRGPSQAEVQMGIGSWGERRSSARVSLHGADWDYSAHVYLRKNDGNFEFTFDPTPLRAGDETERRRQNADLLEGQVLHAARFSAGKHEGRVIAFGYERTGGVPGPAVQPTSHVHRQLQIGHLAAGYRFDDAQDTRLHAAVGFGLRQQRLSDRFGEIGLGPRQSDDTQASLSAHVTAEHDFASWLSATTSFRVSHLAFSPEDRLRRRQVPSSQQTRVDLALEPWFRIKLADVPIDLRPSLRMSFQHAERADLLLGEQTTTYDEWIPGFRLAAGLAPTEGVYVSASAAHLVRTPTITELFGDRAFLRGNTNLQSERATQFDVGLRIEDSAADWRGSVSLRGHASLVDDLIRYTVTSQYQAIPSNADEARILGAELGGQASLGDWARISVATGLLHASNPDAGVLPLRPPFHLYARFEGPEVEQDSFVARLYVDFYHLAGNFTDDANFVKLPSRSNLGVGFRATFLDHLGLVFRVDNIGDQRRQDIVGFPLPGRSFSLLINGKLEP